LILGKTLRKLRKNHPVSVLSCDCHRIVIFNILLYQ